jgi:ribosome-binding protein aMBF1 (putative translation factor)
VRLAEADRSPARRARRQALRRWWVTIARKAARPDGELYRFAIRLRALRTAAGLTVRELAGRVGIAYGYVPMMEAAKLRGLPSERVLRHLAAALGTTVGMLRGRKR